MNKMFWGFLACQSYIEKKKYAFDFTYNLITPVYKHTLFFDKKTLFVLSPLFRELQLNRLILVVLFIETKVF